jgi:cellulose biosynthesis protein BcsQ
MKILSLFNNKGGVGKSTLGYHLGAALGEMGHKTLLVDLDPQCNMTIWGIPTEELHKIWDEEEAFIEDYEKAINENTNILESPRSIHFILKPTEDGLNDIIKLPPPLNIGEKLDLIPGRLSIHKFENKIAERWSGAYLGDNLAIRTITNIRNICTKYAEENHYEYIIIDTSPSLGILNKIIISTVDGFFVPAQPDMFSLYGIKNIGNSLELWQKEFNTIYSLISEDKRNKFPSKFVQFLGFTIYNAKKYANDHNEYDLANAHYSYVKRLPEMIIEKIKQNNREYLTQEEIEKPIGGISVMHTHNTFTAVAQALNCPLWKVPEVFTEMRRTNKKYLEEIDLDVNNGSFGKYRDTKERYIEFATDLIKRVDKLND